MKIKEKTKDIIAKCIILGVLFFSVYFIIFLFVENWLKTLFIIIGILIICSTIWAIERLDY